MPERRSRWEEELRQNEAALAQASRTLEGLPRDAKPAGQVLYLTAQVTRYRINLALLASRLAAAAR
jgi:hypothetical protein